MAADNEFFVDLQCVLKATLESEEDKNVAVDKAINNLRAIWQGQQVYIAYNRQYDQRDLEIRSDYAEMFKTLCDKHHLTFNQILKIIRNPPKKASTYLAQSEMDI
jgi:Mor family transcriptional regulator